MSLIDLVKIKARADIKKIVLPEGDEPRTVKAARIIKDDQLAVPVLLGNREAIEKVASESGVDLTGIETIDPVSADKLQEYADLCS